MPEYSLKNYKQYIERLILFAQATGITVIFRENDDSDGLWVPYSRKIIIHDQLSQSSEIACLLHELGHSMDDLLSLPPAVDNNLHKAYIALYSDKHTKAQRKAVVDCEKRAWSNARDIAKRLKIPLGKWFDAAERYCLKAYRFN